MENVEIASTTRPKIGDRVSVRIFTFVFGVVERIEFDGSVSLRIDDEVRAVPNPKAWPDAFWMEKRDE